jgi:hypothetical protein
MKSLSLARFGVLLLILKSLAAANGQGTFTFNYPWVNDGVGGFSLAFYDGFSFRIDPYSLPYNEVKIIGATGPAGYPHNGTPYILFTTNLVNIPKSLVFAWTDAASMGKPFTNGTPFGLASVDLSDPVAPSLAPVVITFNGFKAGGVVVSQTFTVGGGGSSSFQRVYFGSDFAGGLLRVEIPSPAWAMDNLVWIPEPSGTALLLSGLLFCGLWRRRRKCSR